jgi:hypothetical protein
MTETYPKTIHKLPVTVNRHAVLAWALMKNRAGNYPGGYVLAHNPDEYESYVTWVVYTRNGGETWAANAGHYFRTHEDAVEDFRERTSGSDIADAAPEPEDSAEENNWPGGGPILPADRI